jgi:thiopurine S-methyltransferase
VQLEFWQQRWQANQIGFHQREINAHLQEFWGRLELPDASLVFVPLCGKSRDMLWLRARGYRVLGVEISPIAVSGFFHENELQPEVTRQNGFERWSADGLTILCGDFFHLDAARLADCGGVYDRASLIAMPPEMRPRYARHLSAILPAAASTLLVTMDYPQQQMQGPPFSVAEDEVRRLYRDSFRVRRLFCADILAENSGFRQRGLSRLQEQVYLLTPAAE